MSAAGKVLESILNSRLVNRNIILNIDDPFQSGFKINARTTDNIFVLNSLIYRQKLKGKPLYVCFVDFTKAFDYVNRFALYYKLIQRGIHGKLLKLVIDMYDKAKCRVKWKGRVGGEVDSKFGVLQGGMLSPKLFTEFLYDLKDYLESSQGVTLDNDIMTYILYADDLILVSDSPSGLQNLIDGLYNFCKKWHLIVSLAKTNVVTFGKRTNNFNFTFNNQEIDVTTEYKYLGVIFSSRTQDPLKKTQDHLSDKAWNAIYALNSYSRNTVGQLQPVLSFKMFDTQICPILEYAADVWFNGREIQNMERIHLRYIKSTFHVKMSSCTQALYAESGRFPLTVRQKVQALKYWYRILTLNESHVVRKAYNSLFEMYQLGQENWCLHIRNLLYECDFQQLWDEQRLSFTDLNRVVETIYTRFMETCMASINDSSLFPKLRTYKTD